MLMQIAMVGDLMAALQDRLHGCRITFHTPGRQKKGLVHAEALIEFHQARYGNLWPIAQQRNCWEPRVRRGVVRQMQNAVSVHIKGKGHRTPGTVGPWHGISDHRLSSSMGLRL